MMLFSGWAGTGDREGRWSGVAAGGVAALACAAAFALLPAGQYAETWAEDARFRLRGPRPSDARVAVVAIDDDALAAWEDAPLVAQGARYAALIGRARAAGAKVVALDFIPDYDVDAYLASVGAREDLTPNRALAEAVWDGGGSVLLGADAALDLSEKPHAVWMAGVQSGLGLLGLPPARGGSFRDALLYAVPEERPGVDAAEVRPGMGALLAARATGNADWPPAAAALKRLAGGRAFDLPRRPQDAATALRRTAFAINFRLRHIPTIPALALERGALSEADRDALRDAAVLVGFTNADSQDRHPGLYGRLTPGVLLHAEAAATLLDGRALRRLPAPWLPPVLALLVGLALAWLLPTVSLRRAAAVGGGLLALAALYAGAAQAAFAYADLLVPVAAPLTALAVVPLAHFAARSGEEHRRWREMRAAFARYVSPAVAEYLLASEENRRPGGRAGTATCLFLDLRDSMRFALDRPADAVMGELNEMFAVLVPEIQSRGGSVFKYTGDGLLAVFNAPVAVPEGDGGAQAAVDAALAMHRAVAALNAARRERDPGAFPLVIGSGVHTGPLVFGNLGTADRPEFTVIGDTVNVAARLEALTKPEALNAPVVTSDDTYRALARRPEATEALVEEIRGHGPLAVRGLFGTRPDGRKAAGEQEPHASGADERAGEDGES